MGGLSAGPGQSQVLSMLEDRTGHLWFATNGRGLTRFDGSSSHTFTTSVGLSSNLVYALAEDGAGILWVGTEKGLDRFDGSSFSRFVTPEVLTGAPVWTLAVGPGGEILAAGLAGVVGVGASGARLLIASADLPHARVNGLAVQDGTVWFSNLTGGRCRYELGRLECWQPGRIGDQVRWVSAVIPRRSGGLWIATDQRVFVFDDGAFSAAAGCAWAPYEYVFGLVEDRLARLWVATSQGGSSVRQGGLCADQQRLWTGGRRGPPPGPPGRHLERGLDRGAGARPREDSGRRQARGEPLD